MSELLNHFSQKALSDYDRLKDECGLLNLTEWAFFLLSGDDRKGWLQGQATNDLRTLDAGASTSFCLCGATGHLEAVADVWGLTDAFAISCEKGCAEAVQERVRQMVVLENVEIEDVSERYQVLSVQGPSATRRLGDLMTLPKLDFGTSELAGAEITLFRSNRTGLGGWDLWIPTGQEKAVDAIRSEIGPVDPDAFEVALLEAGTPRFGRDYTAKTLPPELGSAFQARYISYTKGCYTGQEVLMRIHSRGHTNRTWVGLIAESPLSPGQVVSHRSRKDAGVVTSTAFSPDYGPIAAAMVRNEVAEDREGVLIGDIPAEIRLMPIMRLT